MENLQSKLYTMIRQRAGSHMLRKAESIEMYNQVSDFLSDNNTLDAIALADKFHHEYFLTLEESQMTCVTLAEICEIDSEELKDLPWIYVHMLQTLTWHDELAAKILNERLAASPAAAWRQPLPEGISNANSFNHVFNEWLSYNQWIESFDIWMKGSDYESDHSCHE